MEYNELEKLQRARLYLAKMIRGINPADGSALPQNDISEESRVMIRACLKYVSDVLGALTEGAQAELGKNYKQKIRLSEEKVNITAFVSGINEVLYIYGRPLLTISGITGWLLENEYLCEVRTGEKILRVASEKAEQIGISSITRYGKDGRPYEMNLYGIEAQKFIIENLEEIFERSSNGKQQARKDKRTGEESP